MIASLNGRVLEVFSDSLVVGVGGVGLQVFVPAALRESQQVGDLITLHTVLVVRQDALTLFGFASLEEREFFSLLLTVDGIGPKTALAMLSTLSTEAIRRAVLHEQSEVFTRVPGIGKKTAQKILIQLQDRLPSPAGLETLGGISDVDSEVIAALTALGYSAVEAQAALQAIPRDTPLELEARLRAALQYFT